MKTLLFLHFRNFGDAVIGLGLVEAVHASQPEVKIDVLSRPEFSFLFENQPGVQKLYTASFPIGTLKRFTLRSAFHLVAELFRARKRRYDAVANLFGDVRENFAGWIIKAKENYSIVWPEHHPVRIQSRIGPVSLLTHPVFVEDSKENIYAALNKLAVALGATAAANPQFFDANRLPIHRVPSARRIGLHVSAGQECKRWPMERWVKLASALLEEGSEVRVYCAPGEKGSVLSYFGHLLSDNVSLVVVAGRLEEFLQDVATCAMLVAHDSFGIHAANALGVPRIMINGPNVAEVWSPPGTTIIHGDEGIACFPCYGKPTCTEGGQPYACIKAISVGDVEMSIRAASLLATCVDERPAH